jgi:hypothetical protein
MGTSDRPRETDRRSAWATNDPNPNNPFQQLKAQSDAEANARSVAMRDAHTKVPSVPPIVTGSSAWFFRHERVINEWSDVFGESLQRAALASVMSSWGRDISPAELASSPSVQQAVLEATRIASVQAAAARAANAAVPAGRAAEEELSGVGIEPIEAFLTFTLQDKYANDMHFL